MLRVGAAEEVTQGASSDIEYVTNLAREMVTRYGMSDLGPFALESGNSEVFLGRDLMTRSEYSEEVASKIDQQVRAIALHCYDIARTIMRDNRALIDQLVETLLDKELIDGEEFREIVARYTELPAKQLTSTKG